MKFQSRVFSLLQNKRRPVRGFSFVEVMFAVVILGFGIVMVSAIFPVAIEQTRANRDDITAAVLARDMIATISSGTKAEDYPDGDDGVMRSFADIPALWNSVSGNVISNTDSRYACVPLFRKLANSNLVQISVLVVRRWSTDSYTPKDLASDGDLQPRGVKIRGIQMRSDGTQVAEVVHNSSHTERSIAPGSYLIIRSGDGDFTGRALRVAENRGGSADSDFWSLVPGSGLAPDEVCDNAYAAIIGRELVDVSNPQAGYNGPSQDVAVYITFILPK